ncbi:hypothetical protein CRM22_006453 [Opisthorchis felineus]|uniref:Cystatin domain-containing protein n=1 Tax=Opisthorchis felineus TaxID=147828 RepID=A0A4S2LT53_OPIFE|nr:hypothetical protein CRM22_006453 [Opisthorchis felineus]
MALQLIYKYSDQSNRDALQSLCVRCSVRATSNSCSSWTSTQPLLSGSPSSMLSNCLIFLALFFISPSSETLVGGYTKFRLPEADEIQTFTKLLNLQLPTLLGLTASDVDDFQILGISSQVVSGVNYRINIRLHNNQCYLVTVFQSLPSREDGTLTRRITSVELKECPL